MKKDCYVYPAIFTYEDDGISVEFPDLPGCLTCVDTTEEAIKMARGFRITFIWYRRRKRDITCSF